MNAKITVYGIVQGVGFRPYILRLANELKILGYVKNLGGHAEIMAQAEKQALDEFIRRLDFNIPAGCVILDKKVEWLDKAEIYDRFSIVESGFLQEITPVISPDIATCGKCEKELLNKSDRRYLHPFISCVSCGPRFSIIEGLPYDRARVTMGDFPMCEKCKEEYVDISDRRCHAQTIACRECGPVLRFICRDEEQEYSILENELSCFDNDLKEEMSDLDEALMQAVQAINKGAIAAVKDIGGYHFACRADKEDSVSRLRELKQREKKPFAVMFPSVKEIKKLAEVNSIEESFLISDARPIVLLKRISNDGLAPSVCGESMDIGAFLPCNPVQILLMRHCGPLVMTSGNISGEPIIIEDKDMKRLFEKRSELFGVLFHDRRILTPLDDSVIRIIDGKPQFLRRARGYVPLPLFWNTSENTAEIKVNKKILALGSDLKAAFCIADSKSAVLSQYFGDLEDYDAYAAWQSAIERMLNLYNFSKFICVCDLHPEYFSTLKAGRLCKDSADEAEKAQCKGIIRIQHHHAHIASVMAEHGLKGKVLGFSFDGTGYGTDERVWGGEALLCENAAYERLFHLEYIKICGGNEAPKNAELVKCCYLKAAGVKIYSKIYDMAEAALDNNINTFETSSMGRLFDAVSAILGICGYNEYEGQCAILLEQEAISASGKGVLPYKLALPIEAGIFKVTRLIEQIYKAVLDGEDTGAIALGFHMAIAEAVKASAVRVREADNRCRQAALSGGVFANRLLLSMCRKGLEEAGFKVYVNEAVPNNDGGIALGQAYIAIAKLGEK